MQPNEIYETDVNQLHKDIMELNGEVRDAKAEGKDPREIMKLYNKILWKGLNLSITQG